MSAKDKVMKPKSKAKKQSQPEKGKMKAVKKAENSKKISKAAPQKKPQQDLPSLTYSLGKSWKKVNLARAVYTGGQIVLSNEELISICNFKIIVFSLDSMAISKEIAFENDEICNFAVNDKQMAIYGRSGLLRFFSREYSSVTMSQKVWKILIQLPKFFPCAMMFSPCGEFLALGSTTGRLKVLRNGGSLRDLMAHQGPIQAMTFHGKKGMQQVFTAGEDCCIRQYDIVLGKFTKVFSVKDKPTTICLSSDYLTLVAATFGAKVYFWNLNEFSNKPKPQAILDSESEIHSMVYLDEAVQDKEPAIMVGMENGKISVLKVASEFEKWAEIYAFPLPITKLLHNKGSYKVVSINSDQEITVFPLNNYSAAAPELRYPGFLDEISDIKYGDSDGKEYLAVASNSNSLKLYDIHKKNWEYDYSSEEIILCLDIFQNLIVAGCKDNTICLFRKSEEGIVKEAVLSGHSDSVSTLHISPRSGNYLISGSADKSIKLWSLVGVSSEIESTHVSSSIATISAHSKDINAVRFSPNEKLVASASQDKSIKIWDSQKLILMAQLKGHKRGVWDIAFSPVEKLLASCSGDNSLRIWSLVDYSCVCVLEGHLNSVIKVNWLFHGLILMSASSDGVVKVWNVKKSSCLQTYDAHEGKIWALEVFRDSEGNNFMATGAVDSTINIWEDITKDEEGQAIAKQQEILVSHQSLSNFIRNQQFEEAILFSFEKKFVRGFVDSLTSFLRSHASNTQFLYSASEMNSEEKSFEGINNLVRKLVERDFKYLLTLIRDFNSSVSKCRLAQTLLHSCLLIMPYHEFLQKCKCFGDDLEGLLQGLEVHSSRHHERFEKFARSSFCLENLIKKSEML